LYDKIVKDLITHLLCVDPNERYTIDQFLAHPWIKAGEQSVPGKMEDVLSSAAPEITAASPAAAFGGNKILANVAAMTPDYGIPRTPYKRRAENPLSPGIGLKEVFDVSNAVHRMEEESRRRHAPQSSGLQQAVETRQRQAFMTQLNEEDEEEYDEDHSMSSDEHSGSGLSEDEIMAAGISDVHIQSGASGQDMSQLQRQQQEYQRAQERIAAEKHRKYLRKQQQAGEAIPYSATTSTMSSGVNARSGKAISTSTTVSTIASSSTMSSSASSTNRRRRAGFELNMNQATLLKRRAKNHQTVEQQDQMMMRHYASAVAV
jgi:serine/threonine protein kinase